MNLESKKILAKWMGWEVKDHFAEGSIYRKDKDSMWEYLIAPKEAPEKHHWNPDTDLNDFRDVWNHLSRDQKEEILFCLTPKAAVNIILNAISSVMDAVMELINKEILKEEKV